MKTIIQTKQRAPDLNLNQVYVIESKFLQRKLRMLLYKQKNALHSNFVSNLLSTEQNNQVAMENSVGHKKMNSIQLLYKREIMQKQSIVQSKFPSVTTQKNHHKLCTT